jgi:hypothetical protein
MGSVVISGATSGAVTLAVPDEAGTRTLTLPATTGTILTNDISQAGDTSAGNAAAVGYTSAEGLILTGQGSTSDITFKNDADATVFSIPTGTDDILFPDGAKALFGAGSDLQIFHDGSDSYVKDAGTGRLVVETNGTDVSLKAGAENMLVAAKDGAVTLYYDNASKIATHASGALMTTTSELQFYTTAYGIRASTGLEIKTGDFTRFLKGTSEYMRIIDGGNVGIGTSAPDSLVEISSGAATTAKIATTVSNNYAELIFEDGNAGYAWQVRSDGAQSIPTGSFVLNDRDTGSFPIAIVEGNGTNTIIVKNSRLGIHTDPSYSLHVKGSVGIQGADDANEGGQIDFVGGTSYTGYGKQIDLYQTGLRFFGANSWTASFFSTTGGQTASLSCTGALSKGSGSFKIDHPLESKKDTHHLVHSFIEGPQADLIYRGKVDLVGGTATINIDTAANITDGTFVLLNREVQCFTTNETGWTAIKGSVSGNILTITAQDNTCTDTISWMVIGERKDPHMYGIDWTDNDGKVITEPLKPEE